jgi:Fur family transcriptional regulator, ferric uptake regulator
MGNLSAPAWTHEHGDLQQGAATLVRSRGGRMTSQRRNILEAFRSADEHPTAEEIYCIARERDAGLNLSTVYRTLRWLEREGLLRARAFPEADRSERYDTALPVSHQHFVCTSCRSIVEFDVVELESISRNMERRYGLRVKQATLVLYGLCAACRAAERTEGEAAIG